MASMEAHPGADGDELYARSSVLDNRFLDSIVLYCESLHVGEDDE